MKSCLIVKEAIGRYEENELIMAREKLEMYLPNEQIFVDINN